MKDILELIKLLGAIILGPVIFGGLVFIIAEMGERNIERFWKVVKIESIMGIFINLFLWGIISLKVETLKNFGAFIPMYLIISFIISALIWNNYKRTRLRFEKSSLFTSVSDGYGFRGNGPKSGLIGLLAINSIFIIALTIINIYGTIERISFVY